MYLLHFSGSYFLAIVLIHHMFYLSSAIAIQQSQHQMIDQFNTTHEQQPQRYRRFFKIFDNTNNRKDYKSGDHSPLVVNDGEQPASATTKDLLQSLGHQTNRVLEGATDAVLTPFHWVSHITRYWPLYLVCATIIFGLIAVFYCSCQSKLTHFVSPPNYDPVTLTDLFRQHYQASAPRIN